MIRLTTLAAVAIISASPIAAEQFSETPIGALIVQDESGGRNIPNHRYDAQHTAGGLCQMTDETWRRIAPMIDIDIAKFDKAGEASEFDQNRACFKLLAVDGVAPWTCCNKKLRKDLAETPAAVRTKTSPPATASATVKSSSRLPPDNPFVRPARTMPEMVFFTARR